MCHSGYRFTSKKKNLNATKNGGVVFFYTLLVVTKEEPRKETFYNIIMASVKVAVRVRPFNKR